MDRQINRAQTITAASILFYADGFFWSISQAIVFRYAFIHRVLPPIAPGVEGIPASGGPFESLRIGPLIVTGIVFILISALKIMAGYWLWQSLRQGAVFGLILLGLSTIFWFGFRLPLPPIFAVLQVALLIAGWKSLH